jgi:hypothetical protein
MRASSVLPDNRPEDNAVTDVIRELLVGDTGGGEVGP